MSNFKIAAALIAAGLSTVVGMASVASTHAEPAVGVTAVCSLTGPGIAVCGTVVVVFHELVQLANGKGGFGPEGEVMKVLAVPVKIVDGNIKEATRESGELAKVLRGATGISVRDIKKYGIWGGPNSFFRKSFR